MRTIVVTGSGSGLGAAIGRRLEKEDVRIIGIDIHGAEIEANLGTSEGREHAISASLEASDGRLDGVVSCAGVGPYGEAKDITRVNYFGAIEMLDGLLDALAKGEEPAAVAISSVGGAVQALAIPEFLEACHAGDESLAQQIIDGKDGNTAYVNAKRALAQACRRRAKNWGQRGVRLNIVAPGTMETPMLDKLLADPDHAPAIRALPVPLGRSAPAEEVASTVAFLLGPDARYVHGTVLFVDGGAQAVMYPDQM